MALIQCDLPESSSEIPVEEANQRFREAAELLVFDVEESRLGSGEI